MPWHLKQSDGDDSGGGCDDECLRDQAVQPTLLPSGGANNASARMTSSLVISFCWFMHAFVKCKSYVIVFSYARMLCSFFYYSTVMSHTVTLHMMSFLVIKKNSSN